MDAVFYLLLIVNFGFGVLAVVFLTTVTTEPHDPGVRSLALPFIPLTITTAVQIVEYYFWNRYNGRVFVVFSLLADLAIVGIALGWNYIAVRHYRLNEIHLRFRFPKVVDTVTGIVDIAVGLALLSTVSVLWIPTLLPWAHGAVFAFLFFAAFRGVIIIKNADALLPSSAAAAQIATVSFCVYPIIAYGDLAEWNLPFLDPGVSFWVQAHPIYMTIVTVLVAHYIYQNQQRAPTGAAPVPPAETTRPSTVTTAGGGRHPEAISPEYPQRGSSPWDPTPPLTGAPLQTVTERPKKPAQFVVPQRIEKCLTPRENEILILLYEGYRYREIAEQLYVSLTTVRTHVHHIYEKLEISRREELFLVLREERGVNV